MVVVLGWERASIYRFRTAAGITLFISVLVGFGMLLSRISDAFPEYQVRLPQKIDVLEQEVPTIKAVSVGNSHANAIDFEILNRTGSHVNLAGSDIFETAYTIYQIVPTVDSVESVFIPISYPSLYLDNSVVRPAARIRSYRLLPCSRWSCLRLINGDYENRIRSIFASITRFDHWKGVLLNRNAQSDKAGFLTKKKPGENKLSVPKIKKRARHHIYLSHGMSASVRKDAVAELRAVITYLKKYNVTPILYTPPYHPRYLSFLATEEPELAPSTRFAVTQLATELEVFYKDYNLSDLGLLSSAFKNADHLNKTGALMFSRQLKRDLAKAD